MPSYKDLKIVFMGTPDFAVASLKKLQEAGCHIAAVVTSPDKPAGRGMQLQQSAVKTFALQHHIPVLQPEKLKSKIFLEKLKALHADVQVVVAFRMLPELVWNMPPMGTINLHGSLLPQYRGAAPINWAVINGEKETGVTTFKLQHEIDTGNILLQESFGIAHEDNAGTVHDKMKEIGADLLLKTIIGLAEGSLVEIPQNEVAPALKHAPKIFTDTCKINFDKSAEEVNNLVRGLSPYPGAFTELNGKKLKIFSARAETDINHAPNGTAESDGKTFLKFSCNDGWLYAKELQLEGKKKMLVDDFLRGNKV